MTTEESSQVATSGTFSYLVKIINQAKKADYTLRKLRASTSERFTTVQSLSKALSDHFPTITGNAADIQIGYIAPGHGARGKQCWITDNLDIEDMYKEYRGKKEIVLWLYDCSKLHVETKKGRKRVHSTGEVEATKRTNYRSVAHMEKIEKVEEILKELKEKHTGTYGEEKLRAWAHLIQMDKHKSYSEPPDLPYFKKRSIHTDTHTSASQSTTPPSTSVSPCKRLSMRTACIEQMDKWHSLLEKGGITQQQYDELQDKIMSDMLSM